MEAVIVSFILFFWYIFLESGVAQPLRGWCIWGAGDKRWWGWELTEDSSGRIVTGETGLAHTRSRGGQYMNTRDILQALAWSWDREGGNNRSVWPERQEVHQRSFWPAQQTRRRARQEHNKQHTHCQ